MKTLNIFATALIITLSLNAFADVKPEGKINTGTEKNRSLINLPEMEWGNPADVASASVEDLKSSSALLKAPEMTWGNPEDINFEAIESLKNAPLFPAPKMIWGEPADPNSFDPGN